MLDVNFRLEILHEQKRRPEEDHATLSVFAAIELRGKTSQLGNARETRWDDLVLGAGWQFATAIAHENDHIEKFVRIFLQSSQAHAIAAGIDPWFVMNSAFNAGHRLDEAILQPTRGRESIARAIAGADQLAVGFLRHAKNLVNIGVRRECGVAESKQAGYAK